MKIQAYGGSRENDGAGGRGERYDDGDGMLGSADMTIMSGKLNITGFGMRTQKKKSTSNRASEVEDRDGRLDTEEDCFDLQAIQQVHAKKGAVESSAGGSSKNNAFGMSHNIFDVSSYGEVRLNNFQTQSQQRDGN